MQTKERIFHALFFELIALALIIPVASMFSGKGASELVVVGVGLSLFTVVWNYFYNVGFDRLCKTPRSERSLSTRIWHTVGFEGGLIFITLPTIAWFLNITYFQALMLEAGFLVFFFFYATGFNWLYDRLQPYKWCFERA
ncbi:PACE efflux transporter [Vibrio europaeus]|uniref:PACE efflux transporter n=1 Tax=Vibrio europaeus TaxID=300876 RepID=UPI00148D02C5|nr:PACE efflux transporter [Vibrio europaeus]NOH23495.1 PACE efflux transporter [Vibrio europaeus]